jgi:hypothetical protein
MGWLTLLLPAGCGLDTGGILIGYDGGGTDTDVREADWRVDSVDTFDGLPDASELTDPPLPDLPDAADREPVPTCADMDAEYCADGIECTEDRCEDTDEGPVCRHPVVSDFCLIDGTCYEAHTRNPDNECLACRPGASARSWTDRGDMAPCTGGVCCDVECRLGGSCCTNTDCSGCSGPAMDCGSLSTDLCEAEEGCFLVPDGSCGGMSPCHTWNTNRTQCEACGCFWDGEGDCDNAGADICETQSDEGACTAQSACGCEWTASGEDRCEGTYYPCPDIPDEATCLLQGTCSWNPSGLCDPVSFTCR